jgi:hypothetical protein
MDYAGYQRKNEKGGVSGMHGGDERSIEWKT